MCITLLLLLCLSVTKITSFCPERLIFRGLVHKLVLLKESNKQGEDTVSKRRKRRQQQEQEQKPISSVELNDESLEDRFGLGNAQLRELLEQELPVPREDLVTGKTMKEADIDKNKVFQLPELGEFLKDTKGENEDNRDRLGVDDRQRIDRSNSEEYRRVMQLNPFADADDTMFLEEYDIFPSIFGSGKLVNIPIPYLQTGHGILLIITLLAAFIYAPGNPLTEFPIEIRNFLKQGLGVTYAINTVLAIISYQTAKSKNLPGIFWAVKSFLLGGIAFYEVTQAKDPKKLNAKPDPSDRKSKSRSS